MQQRAKVTIDDNDDDDDDDVKQEVTDTIEKFVQNRHVQTLKYLRHVIDENRHLRLHIEHLKRRQDNPVPSPAIIDPIEPEEIPIYEIPIYEIPVYEIPIKTPEVDFYFYLFEISFCSFRNLYLMKILMKIKIIIIIILIKQPIPKEKILKRNIMY